VAFSRLQELSGEISCYPARPLVAAGIMLAVPDYARAPGGERGRIECNVCSQSNQQCFFSILFTRSKYHTLINISRPSSSSSSIHTQPRTHTFIIILYVATPILTTYVNCSPPFLPRRSIIYSMKKASRWKVELFAYFSYLTSEAEEPLFCRKIIVCLPLPRLLLLPLHPQAASPERILSGEDSNFAFKATSSAAARARPEVQRLFYHFSNRIHSAPPLLLLPLHAQSAWPTSRAKRWRPSSSSSPTPREGAPGEERKGGSGRARRGQMMPFSIDACPQSTAKRRQRPSSGKIVQPSTPPSDERPSPSPLEIDGERRGLE